MRRELEISQLQLSPYCAKQLEGLVRTGLKPRRISNTLDHAGYVMQAERNLPGLIKYLNDYSRRTGTFPDLSDNNFDSASRNSPTFRPYCAGG